MAERARDASDRKGEDDVLNRAAVPGLNDAIDELTLFCWVDLASDGAAVDLFWG